MATFGIAVVPFPLVFLYGENSVKWETQCLNKTRKKNSCKRETFSHSFKLKSRWSALAEWWEALKTFKFAIVVGKLVSCVHLPFLN